MKTKKYPIDKEIRGITLRDLIRAARNEGKLEGETKILKQILYQKLKIKEELERFP